MRILPLLMVLGVLAGCVSIENKPLQSSAVAEMAGEDIARTVRERPAFSAMTAGRAMFGMIGAAAMINAGNRIVEENNLQDPANAIADALVAALADHKGAIPHPEPVTVLSRKVDDVVRAAAGTSRYVVDVQTINWGFVYFPTDWDSYRVIYSAKAQLIDTANGRVLAEGGCARVPEETPDAPTHDVLLANGAARLRAELVLSAESCAAVLKSTMLGL